MASSLAVEYRLAIKAKPALWGIDRRHDALNGVAGHYSQVITSNSFKTGPAGWDTTALCCHTSTGSRLVRTFRTGDSLLLLNQCVPIVQLRFPHHTGVQDHCRLYVKRAEVLLAVLP